MTPKELKNIQKNSGLSVRKFSAAIGISHGDFYRIIHGQKRINERIKNNVYFWLYINRKSTIEKVVDFIKHIFGRV